MTQMTKDSKEYQSPNEKQQINYVLQDYVQKVESNWWCFKDNINDN